MMKTISADFAEMEANTQADEETAQKEYDKLVICFVFSFSFSKTKT